MKQNGSLKNRLVRNRGDGLRGRRPPGWDDPGKPAKTIFRQLDEIGRGCSLIEAQLKQAEPIKFGFISARINSQYWEIPCMRHYAQQEQQIDSPFTPM